MDFKTITAIKLVILLIALAVVSVRLFKKHSSGNSLKISNIILVALGVFAVLTHIKFNPTPSPHHTDLFHYYIGSKYFAELDYTRLYACTAIAESESNNPSIRANANTLHITDLNAGSTNNNIPAIEHISNPAYCKSHFSDLRWISFKNDVSYFHSIADEAEWKNALLDHGFNASPVWTLTGGFISNLAPISELTLTEIVLIDIVLLLGCVACLCWAFGMPVAAFSVIIGTAVSEADWSWIGGSLLRLVFNCIS